MSNMVNRGGPGSTRHARQPASRRARSLTPVSSAAAELGRRIREDIPDGKLLRMYAIACVMGKEMIEYDGTTIKIPNDEKSRAYCHAWLSERGWGRPKQELVLTEGRTSDPDKPDVRSMSLEALRQLAEGGPEEPDGDGVH